MAIDTSKLEFEWKSDYFPSAEVTGGPGYWDISVAVLETDKTTTTDADGKETTEPIQLNCIIISVWFEGHKFGQREVECPAQPYPHGPDFYEKLIRESPELINDAISTARNNFQGLTNKGLWKLGITPERF